MPLVRINLRRGRDITYREKIGLTVHEALVSVGVPKDDRFQVISEHEAPNMVFDPAYLGIRRTEDPVMIQITWNEGRTIEQKKALYKAIADGLADKLGLRREDVFRQPCRGQEGELVVRRWDCAICVNRSRLCRTARAAQFDNEMQAAGVKD